LREGAAEVARIGEISRDRAKDRGAIGDRGQERLELRDLLLELGDTRVLGRSGRLGGQKGEAGGQTGEAGEKRGASPRHHLLYTWRGGKGWRAERASRLTA